MTMSWPLRGRQRGLRLPPCQSVIFPCHVPGLETEVWGHGVSWEVEKQWPPRKDREMHGPHDPLWSKRGGEGDGVTICSER